MPVSLSIKNAPDEMVRRLKERAERHHRSLQGELMAILEVDHGEVLGLAERSGLTACDASYLWLARRMSCELVTLDRRLAAAEADRPS